MVRSMVRCGVLLKRLEADGAAINGGNGQRYNSLFVAASCLAIRMSIERPDPMWLRVNKLMPSLALFVVADFVVVVVGLCVCGEHA